jgi:hypothetical protein
VKRPPLAILLLALACSACVGPRSQAPSARATTATRSASEPNPYIITPAERRLLRALRD